MSAEIGDRLGAYSDRLRDCHERLTEAVATYEDSSQALMAEWLAGEAEAVAGLLVSLSDLVALAGYQLGGTK